MKAVGLTDDFSECIIITYRPVLQAVLIARSAWLKPSAEPMAMLERGLFNSVAMSSTRPVNEELSLNRALNVEGI